MKVHNKGALVYVCRKDRLEKDLNKDGVKEFLEEYGYESNNADYAIERLKSRLAYSDDFPHEIGVFLDYPLGDVKGFISNSGANCKCTGCWKVYCNECDARKTFAKFNKCRNVYSRIWGGRSAKCYAADCGIIKNLKGSMIVHRLLFIVHKNVLILNCC